jgi:hypothetical protein
MNDAIFFRALRRKLVSLALDRATILSAALSDADAEIMRNAAKQIEEEFTDDGLNSLLARIANAAADQIIQETARKAVTEPA